MPITIHVVASRYGRLHIYTKILDNLNELKSFIDYHIYGDEQYVVTIYLTCFTKPDDHNNYEKIDKVFQSKRPGDISRHEEFEEFCERFFKEV